ncbi:MAG TPA: baseplate J/gp47 family protein [Chloroflexia bacterium]|nr:baseplate J/gp47 family protein [Chloroflexia bacterium]
MTLPSPNLDDRDFAGLVEEARRRIMQTCPEWTDLSPGDPGIVLLELFAHLTETMLYRLNRLPRKVYIELLRLIGVRLHPPAPAIVKLVFSRARPGDAKLDIGRGTRVTLDRSGGKDASEPPVFVTASRVSIAPGKTEVEVLAHNCDLVEGELAGVGTGFPGLTVQAKRPPIIAPTGDELDLVVTVEAAPGELGERVAALQYNGKAYRVWREVESFTNLGADPYVYIVDRMAGTITFAPAARMEGRDGALEDAAQALAAAPAANMEIRLWYRRGGGPAGNVAANTLTVLKDPIPGVQVTNPTPATGGRAAESLENALIRGPQQLHSLERAVTARDFELLALYSSRAIARARALTRAALWTYAAPGTVEVLLVPYLPDEGRTAGALTIAALQERETEEARRQIQDALDERRPLGTTCFANWARYKAVRVTARIVVRREEDGEAVRRRVIERLHGTINPLPTSLNATGWPFGQALRVSHVYDVALAEPGVRWVDRVRLVVEEVPEKGVNTVTADANQPHTWYAGGKGTLYRSLNDGDGWEPAGRFEGEEIEVVRVHPGRAGVVAVSTLLPEGGGSRIHISHDCGETWQATTYTTAFHVNDLTWTLRDNVPVLLLATNAGLYELSLRPEGSPVQVLVDAANQKLGFYGVVASTDVRGVVSVAVSAENTGGVYLSTQGGRPNTFRHTGLRGEDIRELAVQYDGPRSFLWAGAATPGGDDPGRGLFSWELRGSEDPPEGWRPFGKGWTGGSCRGIAFLGTKVLAASHRAGVLRLDPNARDAAWQPSDVRCGLPLRDPGRFHPVNTVAADPEARLVMAGGSEGVFLSEDNGATYKSSSSKEFLDKVTLPQTWLFVSGEHDIIVVGEDEANRD